MYSRLYDNFSMLYPSLAEKTVVCREIGFYELIAKLEDGTIVSYYDLDQTVRDLPRDTNDMSEDECKYEFGIRLKRIMWIKGITQNELAKRTGITQSRISDYINGKVVPSFYKIDKIAKVVGCSVDDLRYF